MAQSTHVLRVSILALILALPSVAEAGPPLICFPFQTGSEAVLPWGVGSGWNTPDPRYDISRLTGDTMRLLSGGQPVIARMENMRRATIYALRDSRVSGELLSAVLARALAAVATGTPNADALFDAGYLIESYKQAIDLHNGGLLAGDIFGRWSRGPENGGDGYAMVVRAIGLRGASADMEFAASLMKSGRVADEHRRRASSAAPSGSLLAINLAR